jgi:acid phosphatase/tartrate-resistant acid phosphatase type 5
MEPHPLQVHGDTQFEWFDKVMAASTADYLWVYGHYPMYNADGPHEALVNKIGAQMTKYNASGYFAGHEHTVYEFTNKDKTQAYIVTGAGGGHGCNRKNPPNGTFAGGVRWEWGHKFSDKPMQAGFNSVLVGHDSSTLRFHDQDGVVLHNNTIPSRRVLREML